MFGNLFVRRGSTWEWKQTKGMNFLLKNREPQPRVLICLFRKQPSPIGKYINEHDKISFGSYQLEAIHVPGHSPGSMVYYCEQEKVAFSGDVLFRSSIGRTDLAGGDFHTLITGIKSKLFTLTDDVEIYPGHGPSTTIGFEKKHNPSI